MINCLTFRRGSVSSWLVDNPTLEVGEVGIEIETHLLKVGDGTTQWRDLAYSNPSAPTGHLYTTNSKAGTPNSGSRIYFSPKGPLGYAAPGGVSVLGSDPLWYGFVTATGPGGFSTPLITTTGASSAQGGIGTSLAWNPVGYVGGRRLTGASGTTSNATATWSTTRGVHFNLPFYYQGLMLSTDFLTTKSVIMGVCNNTSFTGSKVPSNETQCVFLGANSADPNLSIMHLGSVGPLVPIPLGDNFPKPDNLNGATYSLELWGIGNPNQVFWGVTRLDKSYYVSGVITNNLPSPSVPLGPVTHFGYTGAVAAQPMLWLTQYWEFNLP